MSKLARPGTLKRTTEDPDIAGSRLAAGISPASPAASGSSPATPGAQPAQPPGPSAPAPAFTPSNTGDADLDQAIDSIRRLLATPRTIGEWIALCQTWRGPAPRFTALGPLNHPQDVARLLQRASEWKPQTILEVGTTEGGSLFLFCRIAVNHALLIAAAAPGADFPADKVPFFKAMARAEQILECIPGAPDPDALIRRIDKILNGRKVDILFIHARRPYKDVQNDYRRLKKKVRPGGLIAFDGIQPAGTPGPESNGGDKLWAEIRPQFSQRAEYLSGASTEYGGIAVVKV